MPNLDERVLVCRLTSLSQDMATPSPGSVVSLLSHMVERLNGEAQLLGGVVLFDSPQAQLQPTKPAVALTEADCTTLAWFVRQCTKPLVGCLVGAVESSATALALLLDGLVMEADATIAHPYRTEEVSLVGGSTSRLTKRIGPARTREFLFLGGRLHASEAMSWGLADRIAKPGFGLETSIALLEELSADWGRVAERRNLLGSPDGGNA